jgi:UMF1 family MFS transporter
MGYIVDFNERLGLTPEKAISISQVLFWILATLVGTVQGGIQALSRSYFGQLIPPERSGEYFGFMDIFGKFACVIGPALYELFYWLTGKACFGILSIILLFILGFVFLTVGKKHFRTVEHAEVE